MKTGVFITPANEPIVQGVMDKYGYTKVSNAINFIIEEYDRLSNVANATNEKEIQEEKPKRDISSWFVTEENNDEGKGTSLCL